MEQIKTAIDAAAINVLNDQLHSMDEKHESRFNRIEDKIDKIVEMAATVATVQEKTQQNTIDINMVRDNVREDINRLDDDVRELSGKIDKSVTDSHNAITKIKYTVDKYINIGIGIVLACGVMFGVLEWVGQSYLNTLKDDFASIKASTAVSTASIKEVHNDIDALKLKVDKNTNDLGTKIDKGDLELHGKIDKMKVEKGNK
jgi:hypothetical protein